MKYILKEIELHPLLNEQDLVKLIYQKTYGPSHILLDINKAKQYLLYEINNQKDSSYQDIEISENLIRVSLKNIKNIDSFFDAFLKTSQMIKGTKEEYFNNINLLIKYIKENNLKYDINIIKELASTNSPVHHSLKYNQEYNPHYRLIHKDLYNKLFL